LLLILGIGNIVKDQAKADRFTQLINYGAQGS